MKMKDLDEGFAAMIYSNRKKMVLFVQGKQLSPHVAIIYNHLVKLFSYTLIGTGLAINDDKYKSLRTAEKHMACVYEFEEKLKKDDDIKYLYNMGKEFYKNMIENKIFYTEKD